MIKGRRVCNCKKGFTLVELVVVIAIMAIAATLVVPNLTTYTSRAEKNKWESYCVGARNVVLTYVNIVNTGQQKVRDVGQQYSGGYKDYTITNLDGMQSICNAMNVENNFTYAFVTSYTVPSKPQDTYGSSDTMLVYVKNVSGAVGAKRTLGGMWFYSGEKKKIVYTFDCMLGKGYEGAQKVTNPT